MLLIPYCVGARKEIRLDIDVLDRGTTGFIMSVLWFLAVQYNGYLRRLEAGHNEEVEEVEVERNNIVKRMANAASSWWPWSETGQGTADTGDAEGEAGKRKERKRNKRGGRRVLRFGRTHR